MDKNATDHLATIEALAAADKRGLLIWLPAAIGQRVYVPSGDGGIYTARIKEIAIYRTEAHDAVMRAVVDGCTSPREFLIAHENKGTHWFESEAEAHAAAKMTGGPNDPS